MQPAPVDCVEEQSAGLSLSHGEVAVVDDTESDAGPEQRVALIRAFGQNPIQDVSFKGEVRLTGRGVCGAVNQEEARFGVLLESLFDEGFWPLILVRVVPV